MAEGGKNPSKRPTEMQTYFATGRGLHYHDLVNTPFPNEVPFWRYMCYNCDRIGHRSTTCDYPQRVPRCLYCGDSGHVALNCSPRRKAFSILIQRGIISRDSDVNDPNLLAADLPTEFIGNPEANTDYREFIRDRGHDSKTLISQGSATPSDSVNQYHRPQSKEMAAIERMVEINNSERHKRTSELLRLLGQGNRHRDPSISYDEHIPPASLATPQWPGMSGIDHSSPNVSMRERQPQANNNTLSVPKINVVVSPSNRKVAIVPNTVEVASGNAGAVESAQTNVSFTPIMRVHVTRPPAISAGENKHGLFSAELVLTIPHSLIISAGLQLKL